MARDPEWISKVFQAGIKTFKASPKDKTETDQSQSIKTIINNISNLTDVSDRAQMTRNMAKSIAALDNEDLNEIFIHNLDDLVDEGIFDHILDEMDDEKFKNIAGQLQRLSKKAPGQDDLPETADITAINQTFKKLMESGKGKQLGPKEKKMGGPDDPDRLKQATTLKEGLSSILKGETKAFYNEELIQAIPGMMDQLFAHDKHRTAETIIDKLGNGLLIENQDARTHIATAMSKIGQTLLSGRHLEILYVLSRKYIQWIQFESNDIPARKDIFNQLQTLIRDEINHYLFEEGHHILEPIYQIFSGKT